MDRCYTHINMSMETGCMTNKQIKSEDFTIIKFIFTKMLIKKSCLFLPVVRSIITSLDFLFYLFSII